MNVRSVPMVCAALAALACGDGDRAPADAMAVDATGVDAPSVDARADDSGPLPTCGTGSPEALSQCVDGARYQADLELIAAPREPGSAHWQLVQDRCADELAALGFTVERHDYGSGVNVVGVRTGTSEPARQVLVAAHYDSTPGCAGADDNATGTAATLETARVLSMRDFARTLIAACWDEEERGLIGAEAYAARARAAGDQIVVNYNFEMVGFTDDTPGAQRTPAGTELLFPDAARELDARERRGDFLAIVADEAAAEHVAALERYGARVGLPTIDLVVPASLRGEPLIGDLRRSDHAAFWDQDYPAMMLTDTSEFRYDAYHCRVGEDTVDNLDLEFTTKVIQATVAAAAESLGLGG